MAIGVTMRLASALLTRCLAVAIALVLATALALALSHAQQPAGTVAIDADDIGGVVTGANGPEAGVWVIAETRDLRCRYIKSVVTDDRGRFVVPDLPKASYTRLGARLRAGRQRQGRRPSRAGSVNITATPAPERGRGRALLPGDLLVFDAEDPGADQFGGKSAHPAATSRRPTGSIAMKNNGCVGCHQLGQLSTRTIPPALGDVRVAEREAWRRRVQSGQSGRA